jgi:hypothetical protein
MVFAQIKTSVLQVIKHLHSHHHRINSNSQSKIISCVNLHRISVKQDKISLKIFKRTPLLQFPLLLKSGSSSGLIIQVSTDLATHWTMGRSVYTSMTPVKWSVTQVVQQLNTMKELQMKNKIGFKCFQQKHTQPNSTAKCHYLIISEVF